MPRFRERSSLASLQNMFQIATEMRFATSDCSLQAQGRVPRQLYCASATKKAISSASVGLGSLDVVIGTPCWRI